MLSRCARVHGPGSNGGETRCGSRDRTGKTTPYTVWSCSHMSLDGRDSYIISGSDVFSAVHCAPYKSTNICRVSVLGTWSTCGIRLRVTVVAVPLLTRAILIYILCGTRTFSWKVIVTPPRDVSHCRGSVEESTTVTCPSGLASPRSENTPRGASIRTNHKTVWRGVSDIPARADAGTRCGTSGCVRLG